MDVPTSIDKTIPFIIDTASSLLNNHLIFDVFICSKVSPLKDNVGVLNELNLDPEMRLKLSENIPWYAAVFGGIPALAGGFIFENIVDERLDDASTFQFKVTGNLTDPKIERLN